MTLEAYILTSAVDKDQWINTERRRWAKYFSVPIADNTPEGFPPRTLAVQRALCVVSQKAPAKLPSVIEALYHSFWVQSNSKIGEPAGFTPVLESVLGEQATQDILSSVSSVTSKVVTCLT
jgi:2-hydroxychromene-2-carboxylate isomerase